jgi:hypothetical protein
MKNAAARVTTSAVVARADARAVRPRGVPSPPPRRARAGCALVRVTHAAWHTRRPDPGWAGMPDGAGRPTALRRVSPAE